MHGLNKCSVNHAGMPSCSSKRTVKNSRIHTGKLRFKCHECARQLMENPRKEIFTANFGRIHGFLERLRNNFPSKWHRAVGKETGKTNRIERFNITLRQRLSV